MDSLAILGMSRRKYYISGWKGNKLEKVVIQCSEQASGAVHGLAPV